MGGGSEACGEQGDCRHSSLGNEKEIFPGFPANSRPGILAYWEPKLSSASEVALGHVRLHLARPRALLFFEVQNSPSVIVSLGSNKQNVFARNQVI